MMMWTARVLLLIAICATIVFPDAVNAEPFSPTLLKLRAEPEVEYAFDASPFELPFTVEGTPAGVLFLVYTKDKAQDIGIVENGHLGWHWVNKVDTCIYYSTLKSVSPGDHVYEWDGRDQDGGIVEPGEYTYYLWAFDNQSEKQQMSKYLYSGLHFDVYTCIQENDEQGLPLANPIWQHGGYGDSVTVSRWVIGNDPFDESFKTSCSFNAPTDWIFRGESAIDPFNFDMVYVSVGHSDDMKGSIQKYAFVPAGKAELLQEWGVIDGFASTFNTKGGGSPGVATDGMLLFTGDNSNLASTDPDADFYIYDLDGYMIAEIDLSHWWSSLVDFEKGGQTNGGPSNFFERNGKVILNCHNSCLNQMVDPSRFLKTGNTGDFFVWTNSNGDYTLDKNFEDTARLKWVCNDYNVGPYKYSIAADSNEFAISNAYDIGAMSFGLLAPDGTGLGYFKYAGDTTGWKKGTTIIDSGTPFDGLYCDNEHTMGRPNDSRLPEYQKPGIFFLGHDSISGVITSSGVSVDSGNENPTPAAFTLSQNSPNPFNPTTSIPFTLPKEGHVTLTVYDITGRTVSTLADGAFAAGSHEVVWDATGMASGVYICRLETAGKVKTMKMTLAK